MAIEHITDDGDRAEMRSLGSLARQGWWLIAPLVILGLLGGAAYASVKGDLESTIQVAVTPTVDNPLSPVRSQVLVDLDTESVILRSDPLLTAFAKSIGSDAKPAALRSHITVAAVPGSLVLKVTYSARSGSQASDDVRALVKIYLSQRHDAAAAEVKREVDLIGPQIATGNANIAHLAEEIAPLRPKGGANTGPDVTAERAKLQASLNEATTVVAALQARRSQLERTKITAGTVESGPTAPKSTKPPKMVTVLGGGLAGLFLGFAAAVIRERVSDAQPVRSLARGTGATAVVTFDGAATTAADLQSVMVALDPRLGTVIATTAVGRVSSAQLALNLAKLSARSGNSTVLVFATAIPKQAFWAPVVAAPLTAKDAFDAAKPVADVDRLTAFVVTPDDPALLGDAFSAALSSLAQIKDCVVVVDAPAAQAASAGQVIVSHADSTAIATSGRLSRRAARDATAIEGLRSRVVVVLG